MAKVREVNGVAYTMDGFVRLICQTIDVLGGEAGPTAIFEAWGDPRWTAEDLGDLQRMMLRLSKAKKPSIDRVGHGAYRVNPIWRRTGRSVNEGIVLAAVDVLKEWGGVGSMTALRKAFGIAPRKGTIKDLTYMTARGKAQVTRSRLDFRLRSDDGESSQFTQALSKTPMIRRDFKNRSLVNLPYPIMDTLVLEGRVYRLFAQKGMLSVDPDTHPREQAFQIELDRKCQRFYGRVGEVFREAREKRLMGPQELVADPHVAAEIEKLAQRNPVRADYLSFIRDERPEQFNEVFREGETEEDWPAIHLLLFEAGDLETHEMSRAGFYNAVADALKIDANAASRAILRGPADAYDPMDVLAIGEQAGLDAVTRTDTVTAADTPES